MATLVPPAPCVGVGRLPARTPCGYGSAMVFRRARASSRRAGRGAPEAADPAAVPAPDDEDVRLLVGSALFDPGFYAAAAGCSPAPERAARHYLAHAQRRGLWPHPLFCPERVVSRAKGRVGDA